MTVIQHIVNSLKKPKFLFFVKNNIYDQRQLYNNTYNIIRIIEPIHVFMSKPKIILLKVR